MEKTELSLFTIKIIPDDLNDKLLFLNSRQLDRYRLTPGQNLVLQVGATSVKVEVAAQTFNTPPTIFFVSTATFNEFKYYQCEPLKLILATNERLVLGPMMGITISRSLWNQIEESEVMQRRAALALEKGLLFYCIRLSTINWRKNTVEAYSIHPENRQWMKKKVPVPQVIYDRCAITGSKTGKSISRQGKAGNIQWVNTTRTFGKWETVQAMRFFTETEDYCPETTFLTRPSLAIFLKKYQFCYIKSNYGKCGRQVFRLEKSGNHYLCKKGGSEIKTRKFSKLKHAYLFLNKKLGQNLILQQGIVLAEVDGSPFDMRVLMQKDESCQWKLSALNFRIARPGAVVTNFSAGARDMSLLPGEALIHKDLCWAKVEQFVMQAVRAMESYFGRLGEIGLDVGLDRDGKLWLLEANSRPSMIAYRDVSPETWNQILGYPLDYAVSLIRGYYLTRN